MDLFVEAAERWLVGSAAPTATDPGKYPPPQLTAVRMQEGYDIEEVDEFVAGRG